MFVELIGGDSGVVEDSVCVVLVCGIYVVIVNKVFLVWYGVDLVWLVDVNNVCLNYEVVVVGGILIVKILWELMVGNDVSCVYGILNGICNYILIWMEVEGISFEVCFVDV